MLWSLSQSLIMMTRMSSAAARSILRVLALSVSSVCCALSLVSAETPSTKVRMLSPNSFLSWLGLTPFSRTWWRRHAASASLSTLRSARMSAASSAWFSMVSPECLFLPASVCCVKR